MNRSMNWRIILILVVIVLSLFLLFNTGSDSKEGKERLINVNLGLDLQGGIHLRMRVETDKAIETQTNMSITQLKSYFKESNIKYDKMVATQYNRIDITGTNPDDEAKIKRYLDDYYGDWNYTFLGNRSYLILKPVIEMRLKEQAVSQARETIENRIDQFGVTEPTIQKEGSNRILIQLPGVNDKEMARIMNVIKTTAVLEFKAVVSGFIKAETEEEARQSFGKALDEDMVMVKTNPKHASEGSGYYVLRSAPVITGSDLKMARQSRDRYGRPAVGFSLTSGGASKIRKFSAANIGKMMAIVLDNRVISAPRIEGTLGYDNQITGNFTHEDVNDMVLVLRSGRLPAPMKTMEQRVIGPSLGADSVRKGLTAAVIGLILVILFMFIYYRGAGLNSVVALLLNMIILMAALAYFNATLTLPGIAGIILTIGMAVDANVLVFERIKEDLRIGKSPKTAIEVGFKKAFVTIFDANLTTIIAAVFLFQFGTGPIKGFSVTLILGIVASMFTAVFVSRVIFDLIYSKRKKLKKISI